MSENVVEIISRNIYSYFCVYLSCKINLKKFLVTKPIKYMAVESLLKAVKI